MDQVRNGQAELRGQWPWGRLWDRVCQGLFQMEISYIATPLFGSTGGLRLFLPDEPNAVSGGQVQGVGEGMHVLLRI